MLGITTECSGSCKTSKMEYFANVINSRNTSSRTPHNFLRPSYNIRNYWGYYVLWVLLKASKKRQISQRKLYSFPWHIKTIKICYFVFIYHLLWHVPYSIEISPMICRTNQRAGFYVIGTSVTKELRFL